MGKHPQCAMIVGCGRIGVGRDMPPTPYLYNHAAAYAQLGHRVQVVAFVDRVMSRAEQAAAAWKGDFRPEASDNLERALATHRPQIVSICTPPSDREEILRACDNARVGGIWCEKPYWTNFIPRAHVQVNYIRRFDRRHVAVWKKGEPLELELIVCSANDIHTTPHFTNLALWWGIDRSRFHYVPLHGPSMYVLRRWSFGKTRYKGAEDTLFAAGGVGGNFMVNALSNLLDVVDGKKYTFLTSPVDDAIAAEEWAKEIIG